LDDKRDHISITRETVTKSKLRSKEGRGFGYFDPIKDKCICFFHLLIYQKPMATSLDSADYCYLFLFWIKEKEKLRFSFCFPTFSGRPNKYRFERKTEINPNTRGTHEEEAISRAKCDG
jgi:hypothetical protein